MGPCKKPLTSRISASIAARAPAATRPLRKAARDFGQILAAADIGLVYGGGSLGLMGETARSVIRHGGRVTGIIPAFLSSREHMLLEAHELVVVDNMHQRKHLMFMKSDAFVALPGGLGTLEEFVEQLTWAQLEQHQKPIVLANIDGFWDPLLLCSRGMKPARASSAAGSSFTLKWWTVSTRSSPPSPRALVPRDEGRGRGEAKSAPSSEDHCVSTAGMPSPSSSQACLRDAQSSRDGFVKPGSAKQPTRTPTSPGRPSPRKNTDTPHAGQKLLSTRRPASLG